MPATLRSMLRPFVPLWAWERLRQIKARTRLRRFRSELVRFPARLAHHNYGGIPLAVWITDDVAAEWYEHDWPIANEIAFLRQSRLNAGARVFDLGAHQGVVALQLAQSVGPKGAVLAVEAHPHNAGVAIRNRDENGMPWLQILNAAVSDRPGSLTFDATVLNPKIGQVGHVGRLEVPAITIDELAASHGVPDVVLIDIEGHECAALRGAGILLASQTPPDLLLEVHAGCGLEELGGTVEDLLRLIPSGKYHLFLANGTFEGIACDAGEFRPFRPGDPAMNSRFFLGALAHRDGL